MILKLLTLPGLLLLASAGCEHKKNAASTNVSISTIDKGHTLVVLSELDTHRVNQILNNYRRDKGSDSSFALLQQALQLSYQLRYNKGIVYSLLHLGNKHMKPGKYEQARRFYNRAIPYSIKMKPQNSTLLPQIFNQIGYTYLFEYQYDSALYSFHQTLTLLKNEKKVDTLQMAWVYMNIGTALEKSDRNFERALAYTRKALQWGHHSKDATQLAKIYGNLAALHYHMDHHDSARVCFSKARQLYQQLGDKEQVQKLYNLTASMWLFDNNIELAKLYVDSALQQNPGHVPPDILHNIACIHYYSGHLQEAVRYYEQSLPLWQGAGEEPMRLFALGVLATIYDSLRQYRSASFYRKTYAALKDSIVNEEKIRSLNQMEVKYRMVEKDQALTEKQLLIARQQNKLQQQYLGLAAAIIAIISLFYVIHRRKKKTTIAQLKASLAGQEQERQRMASELHDGIVSKLTSVKMNFDLMARTLIDSKESAVMEEAIVLLDQSIAEIRTTSHNLQPSVLKNAGLAAAVDLYCKKISQISPTQVQFSIFGCLPALSEDFELNVYRILQELVQNMVKHAAATVASIQFNVLPDKLLVTIEDNGIGLPAEQWDRSNGIGLHNLHQRLAMLGGTIDMTTVNGTSIYLSFDFKHNTTPKNEH